MKKVLIFIENGFEDAEFIYPYYRFQEEGYTVDIVGPKRGETYSGKHGVSFRAELSPKEVRLREYGAIVIPGGRAPDRMRINEGLVDIVKQAQKERKLIAAVCHGPQMLIEADIVRGRKATCWKSVATDLKNAGAHYVDKSVVVDDNIVTSRQPADLPKFCKQAINLLKKK